MKAALAAMIFLGVAPAPEVRTQAAANAEYILSVEAPWTAHLNRSDPSQLQLDVRERPGSSLGTGIRLTDLEGLSEADLRSGKPVNFRLVREAGTIHFSGTFRNGEGGGTLRFEGNPAYWSKLAAMGVRNDLTDRRAGILGLPLLDVRSDYIADLRREGAIADLSDYVGMRAVNVRPEMVHELRPLIAGALKPHDLMALAALGVSPDYVREMRTAYKTLDAHDLTSMKALGVVPADIARFKAIGLDVTPQDATGLKALGVTPDYVRALRDAGARVRTAGDAQSFRALGISPAAVKRTIAAGTPNPSASDVMRMSTRF